VPIDKSFRLLPDQASAMAGRVDALALFLLAVCGFFTLLILGLIVWFGLRFRRRTEDEVPPKTGDHVWMEVGWTVVPLGVLMVMFAWGARLYVDMKRPPAGAMEVHVIGKQWMWKLQHPNGTREVNELHVPAGRPVKLIMTSQDVIHSFGIPAFRVTQDVLPGSYTSEWFTATRPGEYHLLCREYCGTLHSGMVGRVVVMRPADYEAWLAGTVPDEAPAAAGARLFASFGCAQCHGQIAPTLAGLYGRTVRLEDGSTVTADEAYLRESIVAPAAKVVAGYPRSMPSFQGQLSEEELLALVAYIKSLGAAAADVPATGPAPGPDARRSVSSPATRPVNGYPPDRVPNQPPARQPPGVTERMHQGSGP
jgi:cytochrome c oxidase subunit 2